ncbi:MAG: CDP-alcohol phosphatidyltransferase family protein [Bacteroidales bacterium]|nr:CDP-alcohol phosphatidyltransferase family protein [Bacteroidales bacterium]
MEQQKQAVRIQTSVLNGIEKKTLVWMAQRLPKWVTSDFLTFLGVLGAVIASAGYVLSNYNILYLWIATGGILLNWFGDSLDGTVARVRNTQRPIYGYFLDHNIDGMTLAVVCVGAGFSSMLNLAVSMSVFGAYMLMTVFTYINTHLRGDFRLTYGKMGPTEFRLIIVIINTLVMYVPYIRNYNYHFTVYGTDVVFSMFDFMALGVTAILLIIYIVVFCIDLKKYSKMDPLDKTQKND